MGIVQTQDVIFFSFVSSVSNILDFFLLGALVVVNYNATKVHFFNFDI